MGYHRDVSLVGTFARLCAVMATLPGCDVVFDLQTVDGEACLGRYGPLDGGLFEACVFTTTVPPLLNTTAGQIDTDADCNRVVAQQDPAETEVCIVAATNVVIESGITVTGTRPLVLVALEILSISGTLDASSGHARAPAAGATSATCAAGAGEIPDNGGGGGGAGASFGSMGGAGAEGNDGAGGAVNQIAPRPAYMRGGCAGGAGGDSSAGPEGGAAGAGGGAVYLIAGTEILISGRINASGAAGLGGRADSSGRGSGGGGGGSGGVIGFDAPMTTIAAGAILIANGGGGGSGGGTTSVGQPGGEANLNVPPHGAAGGVGGSGIGGNGAFAATPAAAGTQSAGGGGGGLGFVVVYGERVIDQSASLSPAAI